MAPGSKSSKRARRADSDRGRSPRPDSPSAVVFQQMLQDYKESVIRMVLTELPRAEAAENALPCPFQRRNPYRYAHVKDPACNGRGFKDIADLRDHIKRAHSSKYGCHYCKDRFQGRDNQIEDTARIHREKCKRFAKREVEDVSRSKPEVMSPEADVRYFRLDFRRKSYKGSSQDKQHEQYWEICKAIWPEYENRLAFESLDLRNKAGVIPISRLSEILENAMNDFDLDQYSSGNSSGSASPHASPNYTYAPDVSYETSTSANHSQLSRLNSIPQPDRYALRNPRDSAYGSNSQTGDDGAVPGGQQLYPDQTCWRYPDQNWSKDQMLTDDLNETVQGLDQDMLMGISPGYIQLPTAAGAGVYEYMTDEWDEDGLRQLMVS